MLCPGSAAASAELSAALRTVSRLVGVFDGALEHAAGSLRKMPVSWLDREAGPASSFHSGKNYRVMNRTVGKVDG